MPKVDDYKKECDALIPLLRRLTKENRNRRWRERDKNDQNK